MATAIPSANPNVPFGLGAPTGVGQPIQVLSSASPSATITSTGVVGNVLRKIRASMAAAQGNNPDELQPLVATPAWAATTAYAFGAVVTISGIPA